SAWFRLRQALRACLKIAKGAAARDSGFGQGGEGGASPKRAVPTEPTLAKDKRAAAQRVFAQKVVWLRCSSVEDPQGVFSFVAPRQSASLLHENSTAWNFKTGSQPLSVLRPSAL